MIGKGAAFPPLWTPFLPPYGTAHGPTSCACTHGVTLLMRVHTAAAVVSSCILNCMHVAEGRLDACCHLRYPVPPTIQHAP